MHSTWKQFHVTSVWIYVEITVLKEIFVELINDKLINILIQSICVEYSIDNDIQ